MMVELLSRECSAALNAGEIAKAAQIMSMIFRALHEHEDHVLSAIDALYRDVPQVDIKEDAADTNMAEEYRKWLDIIAAHRTPVKPS
ncbi:hypothetical protein ACVME8_003946 [Bradyrhizobium diazoefficiens]